MRPVTDLREMEARVSAGDIDAQHELALSLLSGRDGQIDAPRASDLLQAASTSGHAPCSETLASLEAMGAGRVQSWERALDYLVLAAVQGSQSAQAQLMLLARDVPPDSGSPAGAWRDLRDQIDIGHLTASPERRSLCDDPRIRVIDRFATKAECQWLIARASGGLTPATVYNPETGDFMIDPTRSNTGVEFSMTKMDVATEVIRARISNATNLPVPVFEPPHVLHYFVGQEFSPHYDFLDPANSAYAGLLGHYGQRIATFLIYLNEDFEGGETAFPAIGLSHKGRTGDALFFANVDRSNQPDLKTLHAGVAPTSGEKWIFSQWIRNQAPGAGSQ